MKNSLTRAEVSEITGLSHRVLADLANQDKGPPYFRLSRNVVFYKRDELQQWIEDQHRATRVIKPMASTNSEWLSEHEPPGDSLEPLDHN